MSRWMISLVCMLGFHAAHGGDLWKCGDVFTDQPAARTAYPCKPANAASVIATLPRTMPAKQQRSDSRIEPVVQGARDREARGILQAELADTLARRDALLAAGSSTPPATLAASLRRLDADIDGLRREINRRPQETP